MDTINVSLLQTFYTFFCSKCRIQYEDNLIKQNKDIRVTNQCNAVLSTGNARPLSVSKTNYQNGVFLLLQVIQSFNSMQDARSVS